MARHELKYLVPVRLQASLRRRLEPFLSLDSHARHHRDNTYTIHSIYLDTPGLDYYYEKDAGLWRRLKLRVRGYDEGGDEATVFLEIKRKAGDLGTKDRAPIRFRDLPAVLASGDAGRYLLGEVRSGKGADSACHFLYHVHRYSLRPAVLVRYDREAYFETEDPSVRLTFDKNLRGAAHPHLRDLYADIPVQPSLPGCFVLEVKFGTRFPEWLWPVMEEFRLERQSVSKYCTCVDDCRVLDRPGRLAAATDFPPWS